VGVEVQNRETYIKRAKNDELKFLILILMPIIAIYTVSYIRQISYNR